MRTTKRESSDRECDELRELARELLDAEKAYRLASTLDNTSRLARARRRLETGARSWSAAVSSGVVVALAVGASPGLFVLWSWGMDQRVARQQRRETERLRRDRQGPPVLGGAPRHFGPRSGRR